MTEVKTTRTFTDWLRARGAFVTQPAARALTRMGVHPNAITLAGFVLTAAVGVLLAFGKLTLGGVLLWFTSAVDAFDGALARESGRVTRFGGFLDSTLDRIAEGALFGGLLVWLVNQGRTTDIYLTFAVALGSVMVSYARARAEGAGFTCKVGILTRVERIALLGLGLILHWVTPMLILMTALTWITVLQRIWHVYRQGLRE